MIKENRPLLCHPHGNTALKGHKASCSLCGSFWDVDACQKNFDYTDNYPAVRMHFDEHVVKLKESTLCKWLSNLHLDTTNHVAMDVGFGGGFSLAYLKPRSKEIYGIEAVQSNIEHAVSLGIPQTNLYNFNDLPQKMPRPVSLWLFLDSFEHIPTPDTFMSWAANNSSDNAYLLVVSPDAASLSCKFMGRFWPHRLPDHQFFWSSPGLIDFMKRFNFHVKHKFCPIKRASTNMIINHFQRTRLRPLAPMLRHCFPSLNLWMNIGEMGILFQRTI